MIEKLIIKGPFKGITGYDHHVRAFVRHLLLRNIEVELHDLPDWSSRKLPEQLQDSLFDSLNRKVNASIVVHFCMPDQVVPVPGKINVNFTMFEASKVPQNWIQHNLNHDFVIVPTESCRIAWINSGFPKEKIGCSPLGVEVGLLRKPMSFHNPSYDHLKSCQYRFLNISDLRPRKNLLGLIRTWVRATSSSDSAVLILKLNYGSERFVEEFESDVLEVMTQLGKSLEMVAPIHFIFDLLSDEEIVELHHTATHYISLSKGEGWDLPMTTAAAIGTQLIAPEHSAYCTYLSSKIAYLIPSLETPAKFEGNMAKEDQVLFDGLMWWQPDEEFALGVLNGIINGNLGNKDSGVDYITENFSWEAATGKLLDLLGQLILKKYL